MEKAKIYISGKISGLAEEEAKNNFEKAEKDLIELGFIPINPMKLSCYADVLEYEDFIRLDMNLIDISDGIYLLKNWTDSQGARREYHYAHAKKKDMYFEGERDARM